MNSIVNFRINFKGGIISPGDLYNILIAATKAYCHEVSFGLRQELFIQTETINSEILVAELNRLQVSFETGSCTYPCIVSSYPAEEIFINNTWVSEGVYKDIFDLIDYRPTLKLNISDSNQSFTPLLTGNINWVASVNATHFWHLFIRFPKTNTVCEWNKLVYTNDIARISRAIEELILVQDRKSGNENKFSGDQLFNELSALDFITRPADQQAKLPVFRLPYYEGLNRYNNKSWLGIYRRDEMFDIDFLKEVCQLSLTTRIGQICSTPWKSIIIKGIEEKDRILWNNLLDKYQINMRHAANELNFQVEDQCNHARALKQYLVRRLNEEDTRSFGICLGIKTKKKSEVFSSILIRRKPLITILNKGFLHVYDILCARDFNPNERTGFIFSSNNPKFLLSEQLRRAILLFYRSQSEEKPLTELKSTVEKKPAPRVSVRVVHQCNSCLNVYDEAEGDPDNGIPPGLSFADLPENYSCMLCEEPKKNFQRVVAEQKAVAI